jgi:hypothetical protein
VNWKQDWKMNDEPGFEKLIGLFEQTHGELQLQAGRAVNTALVVRNWLFGWYIVEFEKGGANRQELYGKKLVEELSIKLTKRLGKGFSRRSLDQFRQFYEFHEKIWQTVSAESLDGESLSALLGSSFNFETVSRK